ncbi:MAG TPA: deoxyribose-phosphate aldolase [Egibacteraceae bacterium]|nr:deoxyribose-phosphate aldolase [Egibacteraceae bacterium]
MDPSQRTWTVAQVAARLEATLLRPEATAADVARLCATALQRAVRGVCVAPVYVAAAAQLVAGSGLRTVTVAGFPSGATVTAAKVAEVRAAAQAGADEVDCVAPYGRLLGGEEAAVAADLEAVVGAAHAVGLAAKVIVEAAALPPALLRRACHLAVDAGADWVKSSTGFGPGGATVAGVRAMRAAVGDRARVKAAGGIRGWSDAVALLEAGADSLGCSAVEQLLAGPG